MILISNFADLLLNLGFTETDEYYKKEYASSNVVMGVSFAEKRLCFPDVINGTAGCTGFNRPLNFVMFECVNRLLEKGYSPEHITIENDEYGLQNDATGECAEICVRDMAGDVLFFIECTRNDNTFNRAIAKAKEDGGRLFPLWQRENTCKWLAFYVSDYKDGKVEYKCRMICCSDDPNVALQAENDETLKLYRDTGTESEKYLVWKETYNFETYDDLVFPIGSVAYDIGVKPLRKRDLREFSSEDKIVNSFEEILRHNNVSDRENAFNRLVAMFICKLVDESTKNDDDELEFQYRKGEDTYETLQDRLQRLHRDGMEKFMREEIFYVPANYPEQLFMDYYGEGRDEAIESLNNVIRILKFYSNNDFAFKDVHNEELFYQNGKILVEMVQLFQGYKIVYSSRHQFLGKMFEELLNNGFKQNEGQFFTPGPITRFIWDSLPVLRTVKSDRGTIYPKIIDYACGAGHFLTEAVEAVNFYAGEPGDNSWVRNCVFGIEKDYRLARVSKISLFMNGAGEGNIIFSDGLENAPDKDIKNESFDIIVSNPPYSVKDFKQHLYLKNNTFRILDSIGAGGEIETLFVERIGQLLKPRGVAAVILPMSIRTNRDASYIAAREEILQNFYIRAIVTLSPGTFGATGISTMIMFLEKFDEPPKKSYLCTDSVSAIFGGEELTDWKDSEILDSYLLQIKVGKDVYKRFLNKAYNIDDLKGIIYFSNYMDVFSSLSETTKMMGRATYRRKSSDEQREIYLKKFYDYAFAIEKEKLYYFSLVYSQSTLIVNVPTEKKALMDFLGYRWDKHKEREGIVITNPGGKMYNDSNRAATGTLACAIRNMYEGVVPSLTGEQLEYASVVQTKDMLDFMRTDFDKTIWLNNQRQFNVKSIFGLRPLGSYSNVIIKKGESITKNNCTPGEYKVVAGGIDFAYTHDRYNRDENVITISASGANAGYVNFWREKIFASDCTTIQTDSCENTLWIYYYLLSIQEQLKVVFQKGSAQPHVYPSDIATIPIPSIGEQTMKLVVENCKVLSDRFEQTRMTNQEYHKLLWDTFIEMHIVSDEEDMDELGNNPI